MENLPYWDIDALSIHTRSYRLVNSPNKTLRDLFCSKSYIALFTLLHKYGKLYHANQYFQKDHVPPENFINRCISSSKVTTNLLNEKSCTTNFEYVEGITTQAPFNLHAFIGYTNTRHDLMLDVSRKVPSDKLEHFKGYGIPFDEEFVQYSINYQDKNPGTTLSYLKSGRCVLTWKDLVQGNIEGYRYTVDDAEQAFQTLIEFSNLSIEFLKEISW